jgi:hypothetical protein
MIEAGSKISYAVTDEKADGDRNRANAFDHGPHPGWVHVVF